MLKLLLIAPTCDGQDVGEALAGYRWVRQLATRYDVTVLTYHKQDHMPLSRQFPDIRIIEWEEPPGLGRAERLNSMVKPAYVPFYMRARRWIRAALARGERFDVAHQPVPLAIRYPSPVAGLGIPFVLGPVGGSLQSPPAFACEEGTNPWYVGLRGLDALRLRHDPRAAPDVPAGGLRAGHCSLRAGQPGWSQGPQVRGHAGQRPGRAARAGGPIRADRSGQTALCRPAGPDQGRP